MYVCCIYNAVVLKSFKMAKKEIYIHLLPCVVVTMLLSHPVVKSHEGKP